MAKRNSGCPSAAQQLRVFYDLAVVRRIEEGKGGKGSDCLRRNLVICLLHPTPSPLSSSRSYFPSFPPPPSRLPLLSLVGNSPTLLFLKNASFFDFSSTQSRNLSNFLVQYSRFFISKVCSVREIYGEVEAGASSKGEQSYSSQEESKGGGELEGEVGSRLMRLWQIIENAPLSDTLPPSQEKASSAIRRTRERGEGVQNQNTCFAQQRSLKKIFPPPLSAKYKS